MKADFSGYATKAGLKCTDGRTITPDAFKHQDKAQVPLVWQHGHNNPENVLGHTILTARPDGVWADAFFNDTPKAQHMKTAVEHKDIRFMSIWANQLIERQGMVLHGAIREVSLVLSGANPGALIENVTIRHSDGDETLSEDDVIIHTGLEIEHADGAGDGGGGDGQTVQEIYDSMNDAQKEVLHYMLGQALEDASGMGQSSMETKEEEKEEKPEDTAAHGETEKEGKQMTNVFEKGGEKTGPALSHADAKGIFADAMSGAGGSLREAVTAYAVSHGINQIDTLFPEATALTTAPEFYGRRTEWVNSFMNGARKTPFSRVKTHWADLTYDDARAKGYITGTEKQEEFYGMARRETSPQTVYKKQKLDRDDIIDITDFDVVTWMKGEMRIMLDEEIARAALISDGRAVSDPDKILEDRIRPISKDDPMFALQVKCDFAAGGINAFVDAIISWRSQYRGTGNPTLYTSEALLASTMLLKDQLGRRIYSSLDQLKAELRVSDIVPVDIFDPAAGSPLAILVNPIDYTFGADKGGQVTLFDDFDIDFNQYKYLLETRCSGALTKLKSAIVVTQGTYVAPPAGTIHVIVPEPANERQSNPPVHGSLPDAPPGP